MTWFSQAHFDSRGENFAMHQFANQLKEHAYGTERQSVGKQISH